MIDYETRLEFLERLAILDADLAQLVTFVLHSDLSIKEILNLKEGDLCVPLFTRGLSTVEQLVLSTRCPRPQKDSRETVFRWDAWHFPDHLADAADGLLPTAPEDLYDLRAMFEVEGDPSESPQSNVVNLNAYRRRRRQ